MAKHPGRVAAAQRNAEAQKKAAAAAWAANGYTEDPGAADLHAKRKAKFVARGQRAAPAAASRRVLPARTEAKVEPKAAAKAAKK